MHVMKLVSLWVDTIFYYFFCFFDIAQYKIGYNQDS